MAACRLGWGPQRSRSVQQPRQRRRRRDEQRRAAPEPGRGESVSGHAGPSHRASASAHQLRWAHACMMHATAMALPCGRLHGGAGSVLPACERAPPRSGLERRRRGMHTAASRAHARTPQVKLVLQKLAGISSTPMIAFSEAAELLCKHLSVNYCRCVGRRLASRPPLSHLAPCPRPFPCHHHTHAPTRPHAHARAPPRAASWASRTTAPRTCCWPRTAAARVRRRTRP